MLKTLAASTIRASASARFGWAWLFLCLGLGVAHGASLSLIASAGADTGAADGATRTNRLAAELSPYLRLHAHDPVDWYPWGPEAIEKARREEKPIFLSIGYSTCYWCHVMERQVFSDPQIAALMNEWFVNIKVDREERPDLDQIYMTATQLLADHGGWPNSIFLTPDLEPFFAGTYFPPRDTYEHPGFPGVLRRLHDAWKLRRAEVLKVAARVTAAVRELEAGQQAPPMDPDSVLVDRALGAIRGRYDARYGGFGGPPKFPPCIRLEFLLADPQRMEDERFVEIVSHTLRAMARGGIHDQIGGGFHRYATDAEWRLPHFEKMLYTQAQLASIYLRAYRVTGEAEWRRTAEGILGFVRRELTAPEGGFYSALDAESAGAEGRYYLWTEEEIAAVLGEGAELFFEIYELEPTPEGEAGVIYLHNPPQVVAAELEIDPSVLQRRLDRLRGRLHAARMERTHPHCDDKIVTAWNGMMIAAFAEAYEILGDRRYLATAQDAARFLLIRMRTPDGGLRRIYRAGQGRGRGFLEDYACAIRGLLTLHRADGQVHWLRAGEELADQMITRFWDKSNGGFFFAEAGTSLPVRLPVRSRNAQDGALPAANAVAVHALLDLATQEQRSDYLDRAERTLRAFGGMMHGRPAGFTYMISAVERYLREGAVPEEAAKVAAPWPSRGEQLVDSRVVLSTDTPLPGSDFRIDLRLEIDPGWHINANPAAADWLVPTSLTLNADLPIELLDVAYPEPVPLRFAATGDTLQVYTGTVELRARLRVDPAAESGRQGDLRLYLQYQACDESRCLQPAEQIHSVRLQVGRP